MPYLQWHISNSATHLCAPPAGSGECHLLRAAYHLIYQFSLLFPVFLPKLIQLIWSVSQKPQFQCGNLSTELVTVDYPFHFFAIRFTPFSLGHENLWTTLVSLWVVARGIPWIPTKCFYLPPGCKWASFFDCHFNLEGNRVDMWQSEYWISLFWIYLVCSFLLKSSV